MSKTTTLDVHQLLSAYVQAFMGQMNMVPVLGESFNQVTPERVSIIVSFTRGPRPRLFGFRVSRTLTPSGFRVSHPPTPFRVQGFAPTHPFSGLGLRTQPLLF